MQAKDHFSKLVVLVFMGVIWEGTEVGGSRAGRPNYDGESPIFVELKEIMKVAGVRRRDLPTALGPNLRRAWQISEGLGNPALREIVERELEALIVSDVRNEPKKAAILRVGFNLGSQDYRTNTDGDDTLIKRLECCSEEAQDKWKESHREVPKFLSLVNIKPEAAMNNIDKALRDNLAPAIGRQLAKLEPTVVKQTTPPLVLDALPSDGEASERLVAPRPRRTPLFYGGALATVTVLTAAALVAIFLVARGGSTPPVSHSFDNPVLVNGISVVETSNGASYVFPNQFQPSNAELTSLDQLNAYGSAYANWFGSRGGVMPSSITITMTFYGNAPAQVTISGMQVIGKCSIPLSGTYFYSPAAATPADAQLGFNLDDNDPVAQNAAGGTLQGSYFQDHIITLNPGEPQGVSVVAETSAHYCSFSLKLTVLAANGAKTTEIVTNNGSPFRVTAVLPAGSNGEPYAHYQNLYTGGVAAVSNASGGWQTANPATFDN